MSNKNGIDSAARTARLHPSTPHRIPYRRERVMCNCGGKLGADPRTNLLRRILGMHESKNCGAYNGEAVLSESVADEIRDQLEKDGVKPDEWTVR